MSISSDYYPELLQASQGEGSGYKTVTTAAVQSTKGSYVELIASTTNDTIQIVVHIGNPAATSVFQVDIATGAAASETVLIPDIAYKSVGSEPVSIPFLVNIPAGTRIAARASNETDGDADTIGVGVTCMAE